MSDQPQRRPEENYGLQLLIKKDEKLDSVKSEKEWQIKAMKDLQDDTTLTDSQRAEQQLRIGDPLYYNEKEHAELKGAIFLLKQNLMVNRIRIEITPSNKELKGMAKLPYLTFGGKTWAYHHHEFIALKPGKKGYLNLTEVIINQPGNQKNGTDTLRKV